MPLVVETIEVDRSPGELYPVVANYADYPNIMENVKEVNILEKGEDYEHVEFICNIDGRVIKWVERNDYKPDENRIDFEQIRGDLKVMTGYWRLEQQGSITKVEYSIYFELGIPMIAAMIHPLLARKLRENMKQMLLDLKRGAESTARV